jgi:hypothetical protein
MNLSWVFLGITFNDSFIINGVDIFKENWVNTGIKTKIKDPLYGEIKTFDVWKITKENYGITFAAGEFSNNVWGIYAKQ